MKYHGVIWVGIHVEDLPAAVEFYGNVLELRQLAQGETWAHFDAGSGSLLELFSGGQAARAAKSSEQQSVVVGLRVADLRATVSELQRRGVQFSGEIGEYEGTRWAEFLDPEGNRLEIKEIP